MRKMRQLKEKMDIEDFLKFIHEHNPKYSKCLNCPHYNGNCVEFAMQGRCKAYHYAAGRNYRILEKQKSLL